MEKRLGLEKAAPADPEPDNMPEDRSFRMKVMHLHLRNKLSGKDTVELVQSAIKSKTEGLWDVKGAAAKGKQMGNANRDMTRQWLKGVKAPEPYWAEIPVKGHIERLRRLLQPRLQSPTDYDIEGYDSDRR